MLLLFVQKFISLSCLVLATLDWLLLLTLDLIPSPNQPSSRDAMSVGVLNNILHGAAASHASYTAPTADNETLLQASSARW
jgi:hypothetical protein